MRRFVLLALLLPLFAQAQTESGANTAAKTSAVTTEVLVSNSVTTVLPTTALVGRRTLAIQNLGPNAIWCTVGSPTTPVVNKSWMIDSKANAPGNFMVFDVSEKILVRCLAETAAQVTGAATIVIEAR